jgi:hypothetical protein
MLGPVRYGHTIRVCDPLAVPRSEAVLSAALRALYDGAGRPEPVEVVRWAAGRRPAVLISVTMFTDWLAPNKMAVPSEGAMIAVVQFLAGRARASCPEPRWTALRRRAWTETYASGSSE